MTENQRYLLASHMASVEQVHDQIEAAGFTLVQLGEWEGGQPHTRYTKGQQYIAIFGHARMELYKGWCNKVDGCRIQAYREHTVARLLAKAVA